MVFHTFPSRMVFVCVKQRWYLEFIKMIVMRLYITSEKSMLISRIYIRRNQQLIINYRWSSKLDWFSRLSRFGKSEKSNLVEMTNANLFIAVLTMTLLLMSLPISLTTPRGSLVSSDNISYHSTPPTKVKYQSVRSKKICKIVTNYLINTPYR